jgi:hypothetical protein
MCAYLSGNSMGGSGCISLAMHFPERFAYVRARVPAVAYLPNANLFRLTGFCGPIDSSTVNHLDEPFLDHMNAILQVIKSQNDLPYIFMISGKSDASIAWVNNPPFYQAMNDHRQGLTAYWSLGGHDDCDSNMPGEHGAPPRSLFRLNRSYLAFSNYSENDNPGSGDPQEGDEEGWINRGLAWHSMVDTSGEYAATVTAFYDNIRYPVTVDLTLRRLQFFKVCAGDVILVTVGNAKPYKLKINPEAMITIKTVTIHNREGTRIHITKLD